ncbi:MAG: S-ribosylhomocysteine lyase [Ruminococcaceae bacterium]|nr:S-ribosylhomocysteine lyase [Oscillospiraceae bacterium]
MRKIASFSVNHDKIAEGIYVSRIDGDITTYDMRMRKPNMGDYIDNITLHSLEHMFATYVRNSEIGENIIYFGPMGCQTGFYLLTRDVQNEKVLEIVKDVLSKIISHKGEMFGNTREECGNYRNLNLECAQLESKRYLNILNSKEVSFKYE